MVLPWPSYRYTEQMKILISSLNDGRLFSLGLLILIAVSLFLNTWTTGQQVGVSLKLHGVTIPNNSLVDLDDILYRALSPPRFREYPSNNNSELHNGALLCVTDLEACCESPQHGDWYYPNGSIVPNNISLDVPTPSIFQSNRGQNEIRNGQQFNGSVRLWRRWSSPPERGHFYCELPSATDSPSVTQTLYANIVNFGIHYTDDPVTISLSGPGITGNPFSLTCSATLNRMEPLRLPSDVPPPSFDWFYGPYGNATLPSGVTPVETVLTENNRTYSSTLQFSPVLNESHAGNYTCRLGAASLINSAMVTVNVGVARVIPSGIPMLGQTNYTLMCRVFITNNFYNPFITYQWIKNNNTLATQLGTEPDTLSFYSLRLSDAGMYTCYAIISSVTISSDIVVTASHDVRIKIQAPISVVSSADSPTPVRRTGTLTCTVTIDLRPEMDIPVIVNNTIIDPAGQPVANSSQPVTVSSMTYVSTFMISLEGRNSSGNYTCVVTLHSTLNNANIISSSPANDSAQFVKNGVYLMLRSQFIANNSQINIDSVTTDSLSGALQCITDKVPCCQSHGEWYRYQQKGTLSEVQMNTLTTEFYVIRDNHGVVSLNRLENVTVSNPPVTGQFCCKVANAADMNQTLCVIIDVVSITPIGYPIAGEHYTLECSSNKSAEMFEWLLLRPPDGSPQVVDNSHFRTITSRNNSSQLQFKPLQQSHNGSYSCRAVYLNAKSSSMSQPLQLKVTAPKLSIRITNSPNGAFPVAGKNYDIICGVEGTENLNSTITYQWILWKKSDEMRNRHSKNLSFTPVRVSDAGTRYSCSATIVSSYLADHTATVVSPSSTLIIQIPTPSLITLTSSKDNSIQIIGSDVALTCAVILNSAILNSEISTFIRMLMVDVHLSKDGKPLTPTDSSVTDTTFIYTTQLNSFQRSDFGSYTCTATIRPQPTSVMPVNLTGVDVLSDTLTIKAAIPPPDDVRATLSSPSAPVEVSWNPPPDQGLFNITGYRIFYGNGKHVFVSSVMIITSVSLRVNESQMVFLRSESGQIFSELVNITIENNHANRYPACTGSCLREVGISVGLTVCLAVIVVTISAMLWSWRKRSSMLKKAHDKPLNKVNDKDLNFNVDEDEYEIPDMILSPYGQLKDEENTSNKVTMLC